MYRYETHLHTTPVSKCARANVRDTLEFYKSAGYDGIFLTNHFIDGNINVDRSLPYEDRINFYFSDYEEAKNLNMTKDELKEIMEQNRIQLNTEMPSYSKITEIELYDEEFAKTAKKSIKRYLYK